jgi:hypothetical protein
MVGLGPNTQAEAVNSFGSVIVGSVSSSSCNFGHQAFIWTPQVGLQFLSNLLTQDGDNLTGWTLDSATAVSADRTIIAGNGFDPNSNAEAGS